MDRNNAGTSAIIAAQVDSERSARFPLITEANVDEVLEWEEQRMEELSAGYQR